ncbi:MAG: hypothetical protein BRC29_00225 [Nanohaloarchaea archaeon SW_7_43_1]|nr:MAG: hypothetical protein BRC29_00225 [Nanohaloarchaea archaeon SW_7_43_1]
MEWRGRDSETAEKEIVVLDASVVVKWFSEEDLTDKSLEIREMYLEDEIDIVLPDLILTELVNALRYSSEFDSEDVKTAIQIYLRQSLRRKQMSGDRSYLINTNIFVEYVLSNFFTTNVPIFLTYSRNILWL